MINAHFLIGVDSDGTAFDSMNRKHLEAFIPAALEIWPMSPAVAERFTEIEKTVNLFSSTRGINRFPGLLAVFEQLRECFPEERNLPATEDLRTYINAESKYSPVTLKRWMEAHPSEELEKVLQWSERADVLFSAACEGLAPYDGVREALTEARKGGAAVAVVSSAARKGLEKDWAAGGLISCVDLLMSQEDGSKTAQLLLAAGQCAEDVKILMLGDTDGDGEAAHAAGALFYPIMPGSETDSWDHFRKVILPQFLAGKYDAAEERKYGDKLQALLS